MKLSKREKSLFVILILMISLLLSNLFIINPINIKISELQNQKQDILNKNNKIKLSKGTDKEDKKDLNEDLMLKIEKDTKQFVNIDYLNKVVDWDEDNKEIINIELKVNGNLNDIFKLEDITNNLNLEDNIEYIEINKIQDENEEKDDQDKNNIVECIMTLRVGD